MIRSALCRTVFLGLSLLLASGCGVDSQGRYAVKGMVYLNDEPLTDGNITFFPDGPGAVAAGSEIHDGQFTIPKGQGLTEGTYKVSITSTLVDEPISAEPDEVMENPPGVISLIPPRFNTETKLIAEVEEGSDNYFTFHVESN